MKLHIRSSTQNSLLGYYCEFKNDTPPAVGGHATLINSRTGEKKNINIENIKPIKNGYEIKNVNITIRLIII